MRASEGRGSLRTDGWNYEVSSYLIDNRVRSGYDGVTVKGVKGTP
jgi:hypothetical protein